MTNLYASQKTFDRTAQQAIELQIYTDLQRKWNEMAKLASLKKLSYTAT